MGKPQDREAVKAIYGTARFTVREGSLPEGLAAIREFVAYVSANEPRTRRYASFTDRDDPTSFTHVMVFEDETAEDAHANSAAVQRFTDVLYPLCVDGVRFERFELVAGDL
jgi:quinol monooxygenase YgiN